MTLLVKALIKFSLVTAEIRKLSTKYDGDMTWRSRNTYKPSKAPAYYYHCCYLTSNQLFPYGHIDTSERFLVVMVSECPSYHTTYLVLSKILSNHFFHTFSAFLYYLSQGQLLTAHV